MVTRTIHQAPPNRDTNGEQRCLFCGYVLADPDDTAWRSGAVTVSTRDGSLGRTMVAGAAFELGAMHCTVRDGYGQGDL